MYICVPYGSVFAGGPQCHPADLHPAVGVFPEAVSGPLVPLGEAAAQLAAAGRGRPGAQRPGAQRPVPPQLHPRGRALVLQRLQNRAARLGGGASYCNAPSTAPPG